MKKRTTKAPANSMISIAEAVTIIKENIPLPRECEVSLEEALGRYLAEDIHAPEPSPRYTNSAMDGFAVRWDDVSGCTRETQAILKIIGESRAGCPFADHVDKGQAIRVSTGAMPAEGCDTVVRVEDTKESSGCVHVFSVKKQGQDLRRRGEEFDTGDLLLQKRTKLSAPQIALLATVGITKIRVFKPCEVAVLVTGSELVAAGEKITDHQIRDSNMLMLQSAIVESGGRISICRRITDDEQATQEAIAAANADIVLCTGGVSVGRHDHVKDAAEKNNFAPLFWRICQKPGKPLYFAKNETSLLFGLPGNPVSAFMCFAHYVRPVITSLNGLSFGWPVVSGKTQSAIANNGKRTNMLRVQLTWKPNGGYCITHAERQGSHMLTSLSDADGYIILEPGQTLNAGERCDVYRYDFTQEPV